MYYGIIDTNNNNKVVVIYLEEGIVDLQAGELEKRADGEPVDLQASHHVYNQETDRIVRKSDADIESAIKTREEDRKAFQVYEHSVLDMTRLLALRALKTELGVNTYDDEISALETGLGV